MTDLHHLEIYNDMMDEYVLMDLFHINLILSNPNAVHQCQG